MLTGQEIGLLSSLQISVVGMLVVMLELFLLYLFIRCMSFLLQYAKGKKPGYDTVHKVPESQTEEVITDLELCCVVGAVVEECRIPPDQIRFTRIEKIK